MFTLNDYVTSLLRTFFPAIASSIITWVCAQFNFILSESSSTQAYMALTGIIFCLYYAGIRALESKWPKFSILLGTRAQPVYSTDTPTQKSDARDSE